MISPIVFETADLFCGAGGTSTGAERAVKQIGEERGLATKLSLVAINHWPVAIETHQKNHPSAQHYVQDVTLADPKTCVPKGFLHLLMASPECTYHSNARGGKPVHDQKRMDPWAVVRWLTNLNVRCLLVENVPEFVDWGPLCTLELSHEGEHGQGWLGEGDPASCGKRDPKRKGNYFQAWRKAIVDLGYEVQFKTLNAADYGDATTRTRLFLMARKDGVPIRWPEPSHARKGPDADGVFGGRQRWRAAREIIDWQNPGRSILDDPKYQKQPLSEKTRKRMARGLERFGGPLAHHFIALLGLDAEQATAVGEVESFVMGKQSSPVYRTLDEPTPTLTTESAPVVITPSSEPLGFVMGKQSRETAVRGLDAPLTTLTTDSGPSVVETVAELVGANRNHNVPRDMEEPVPPATTAPGGGLFFMETVALPFVLGQQSCSAPRDVALDPLPTITTGGAISLTQAVLIPYYRTGVAKSPEEPLETVTTKGRFGLAEPMVVPYGPEAAARDVDQPVHTILGKDRLGVASFIVPQFAERDDQAPRIHDLDEPLPTVTGSGAGKLVTPILVQTGHGGANGLQVRPVDEPLQTIVTAAEAAVCSPCVIQLSDSKDQGHGRARSVDQPLFTATTHRNIALAEPVLEAIREGHLDPRRLIIIDGQLHHLDIRFRMLTNRELARAMSFDDEESEYEFVGNVGEVTKQIGNAVPARTAKALVKTILEDCMGALS